MKQSEPTGRGCVVCLLLIVAFIPAVYVLSLGPAARFHGDCSPAVQRTIETIYAPLVWLRDNTILRKPLDKYVELWEP